jgi:hypothetical protein
MITALTLVILENNRSPSTGSVLEHSRKTTAPAAQKNAGQNKSTAPQNSRPKK